MGRSGAWARVGWVLIVLVAALAARGAGAGEVTPQQPFKATAEVVGGATAPGETATLRVTLHILDDHYIYGEATSVEVTDAAGLDAGAPTYPAPKTKFDKWENRDVELYDHTIQIDVPLGVPDDAAPGERAVQADVRYRGCNPKMCFFPTTDPVAVTVLVGEAAAPTPPEEDAAADDGDDAAEGDEDGADGDAAEGDEDGAGDETTDATPEDEGVADADADGEAAGDEEADGAAGDPDDGEDADADAGTATDERADGATFTTTATPTGGSAAAAAGPGGLSQRLSRILERAAQRNFALVLLFAFLGGLLASLTPCVLPMIPITVAVIGAKGADSVGRALSLSIVYVLGIATLYSVLGVAAAATGNVLGGAFNNPWVMLVLVVAFVALALGMFGVYNFALPASLNTRLSQVGGQGYLGVFVIGLAAGVVASPCTGPVVGSAMLMIAGGQFSLLQGFAVMFAFSLGLGVLFIAIGTFSASIPPGAWMTHVKNSFGFVMLLAAVYFLGTTGWIPAVLLWLAATVLLVMWSVAMGVFTPMGADTGWGGWSFRTFAVLLLMAGLFAFGRTVIGDATVGGSGHAEPTEQIAWHSDIDTAFAEAEATGRPVMMDFTAENCAQCRELEHKTFPDADVVRLSRSFVSLTVDCTSLDDVEREMIRRYGVPGSPRIVFALADGSEIDGTAVQGFVPPVEFRAAMQRALDAVASP